MMRYSCIIRDAMKNFTFTLALTATVPASMYAPDYEESDTVQVDVAAKGLQDALSKLARLSRYEYREGVQVDVVAVQLTGATHKLDVNIR